MSDTFTSLPMPRTTLLGRDEHWREVVAAIENGCPLLTLTGAGGIGKTRLALEVGRILLGSFEQRVVFVELADITSVDDVAEAIATALRVRASPDHTLEAALANAVSFRRTLLILDNMEHVLGAAPLVGRLLERAPLLTVLATSRTPLELSVETTFDLAPLPFGSPPDAALVLFATRAAASAPGFTLHEGNTAAVMELCRRLDGLPLAIELAAARVPMLDPATLVARLHVGADSAGSGTSGLRLLSVNGGDRHRRHRALHDTIAWSVALLTPAERALLDTLVVFEGHWTLDAAEFVAAPQNDSQLDVLDGLHTLLRHHLIVRESAAPETSTMGHDGPALFRMLETIRQFVVENAVADARHELARDRHADYYVDLACRARDGLETADEAVWTSRLEAEDANIRAAVHHLERAKRHHSRLRLVSALGRHWRNSGRWDIGQTWIRDAVECCQKTNPAPELLADALAWVGRLAIESGVVGDGRKGAEEALTAVDTAVRMARELDDPRLLLRCIEAALAASSTSTAAAGRARQLCLEGISISVEIGDRWWQAMLQSWRGVQLRVDGDLVEAELACTTCRAIARVDGNRHMAGLGGWVLSSVLIEGRRFDEAEAVLREAISDNLSVRDRRSASFCFVSRGTISMSRNDLAAGAEQFRDGLLLAQESSDWVGAGFGLMWFVSLASRDGRHQHAARIWGGLQHEADVLLRLYPSQRRAILRAVDVSSNALGAELFERLVAHGSRLGWREATLEALDVADLVITSARSNDPTTAITTVEPIPDPTSSPVGNPDRLSPREVDVLRLIAQGCTNHQIGEQLYISNGTVERHVANLYRKIGARRRAEATVYALRNGFGST